MSYTRITGSPCGDPTCYRGGVGGWNYQYKDGPCAAKDCQWPWQILDHTGVWTTVPRVPTNPEDLSPLVRRLPPRPHFTDTPAPPVVDAGKRALQERTTT